MQKLLLSGVIACFCTLAEAAEDPNFDTRAYCAQVGEAVGGSKSIELTCVQMERQAKSEWTSRIIELSIANYCSQVASVVGGSYQILGSCGDMEESAAAQLAQ